MMNNLQGINSRVDEAENQNNHLENKEAKTSNQNSKKQKDSPPNEKSVRSLWANFKCTNTCIMGGLKVEEKRN